MSSTPTADADSAFERDRAELIRRARAGQPALVETLPDAVRLSPEYRVDRLTADLDRIGGSGWRQQKVYAGGKVVAAVDVDWTVIPLRNIGGDVERTDPGGPGLVPFADTPWLEQAPYIAELLRAFPAPLRAVRLMAAGPGVSVPLHVDSSIGFPWGMLRLHVPIVTNPGAELVFEDRAQHWPAGTFWFGNFARPHFVRNLGTERRVHLVIDCYVTAGLVELFPTELRGRLGPPDALFLRPEVPLGGGELSAHACRFRMPRSFLNTGEPFGYFVRPQPAARVALEVIEDRLLMAVEGRPAFVLQHAGDGEFRLQGWSDERTVSVARRESGIMVRLTARRGADRRRLEIPAEA